MNGYERKIILLKNTGSEIFDEAYFILKDKRPRAEEMTESEMIREANRIVNENLISGYFHGGAARRRDRMSAVRLFAGGFLLGLLAAGVCLVLMH